ncbi:TPA: glycoside hydrolase 43 family protein [Candidatus Sumerlaeota bacterium]|nr:glycoside hydrolase 43 family protein [Candidatus Sumerlaeota bacterium]
MTQTTSTFIQNPVLRGFNPDPSFIRVGDDYYLATSTFEWLPGVRFYHSKDLVNWRLVGHALTRPAHIDLKGVDNSNGSWAPSLSYADGKFWLIYTNIRTAGMARPFKDSYVYLTTAPSIDGPWSDPIHLDSIGFDPALFHDDDGRKWIVNMQWNCRKGHSRFDGIVLQEYDVAKKELVGPVHQILQKPGSLIEGPNLYKKCGYYYLMLAEGGTGWNHGIKMARAQRVTGPYELDPQEALITTRHNPECALQKAGHGELVETPGGEWWLAHLCSRPLKTDAGAYAASPDPFIAMHAGERCMLGRETALQRVVWSEDGWLRLANGGVLPDVKVAAPAELTPHPWPAVPERDDFDATTLSPIWQTLRVFADPSWLSLTDRPGWLRLRGRECPSSIHEQSLVAQTLKSFHAVAETRIDFTPKRFSQMAGLVCWYDTKMFYYLRVTHQEEHGKILDIMVMDDNVYDEIDAARIVIDNWPAVYLRAEINQAALQFSASPDGENWQVVGPVLDASKLSDDYGAGLHFTGAFVGLAAHDVAGQRAFADFDYFTLKNI